MQIFSKESQKMETSRGMVLFEGTDFGGLKNRLGRD